MLVEYDSILIRKGWWKVLIEFGLKNYTSFKEKTLFSAETGERLRKYKYINTFENDDVSLLKNILIFGANGAGKSQLISGLGRMQSMIINGTRTVTDKLNYTPFIFLASCSARTLSLKMVIAVELVSIYSSSSFLFIINNLPVHMFFLWRKKSHTHISVWLPSVIY